MIRLALMISLSASGYLAGSAHAAQAPVGIDTAATVYQEAAIRAQVRASLGVMPARIRQLFSADTSDKLSDKQLAAVTAAAVRGFRIDVFEAPALDAFARNLDETTVAKTEAFLSSDTGKRMVAADVALAELDEALIDKVMSGEVTVPSTPKREAIIDKLERATRSTESTVQIFLEMGEAVAVGTAIGSGINPTPVEERAHKSGEDSRAGLEQNMRTPMRRFMTYGYRDLGDADLTRVLAFMESPSGKHYVAAYNALLGAGFDAMGRRTGEQLGESLRELAQAEMAPPPAPAPPPDLAAPTEPR